MKSWRCDVAEDGCREQKFAVGAGGKKVGGLATTTPDRRHQPGVDGAVALNATSDDADFLHPQAVAAAKVADGRILNIVP